MDLTTQLIVLGVLTVCAFCRRFIVCLPDLIYWWAKDIKNRDRDYFKPYGVYMFCGRQGSGKTMGLTYMLEQYRKRYPKAKIYTNMQYIHETAPLKSLNDLLNKNLYNGKNGTIFVLDEIQNEFSCATSKDFPESLLQLITMQRKQRIVILCSSQVFTRVAKPIREQAFYVINCKTIFGRYTKLKWYDADLYLDYADNPSLENRRKLMFKAARKDCFVQSDYLRGCYNSYALVARLSREGFAPKVPSVDVSAPSVNLTFHKR